MAVPTATFVPSPTLTATLAPEVEALLAPGPTFPAPERIYFNVGHDLWQFQPGRPATQVTRNLDIGPFAPSPDGSRVAVVVHVATDSGETEAIRLLGPSGTSTETISEGGTSERGIVGLAWSWTGSVIAVAYDDGTISALPAPGNVEPPDPVTDEAPGSPAASWDVSELAWAQTDAGLAYIIDQGHGARSLMIAPYGSGAFPIVDSLGTLRQSVRTFTWLPGRGRIAFADDIFSNAVAPGSIFTIAPDGSARELLVSSGQFAPVAGILDLSASPDGQKLAMSVFTPSVDGTLGFHSLWLLTIDTGELTRVPISIAYRITDLWWTATGLVWRGVERSAPTDGDGSTYAGSEPFVLGLFDLTTGQTTIVFQTALVGE